MFVSVPPPQERRLPGDGDNPDLSRPGGEWPGQCRPPRQVEGAGVRAGAHRRGEEHDAGGPYGAALEFRVSRLREVSRGHLTPTNNTPPLTGLLQGAP